MISVFEELKGVCKNTHIAIEDGIAYDTCRMSMPKSLKVSGWKKCSKENCPYFDKRAEYIQAIEEEK